MSDLDLWPALPFNEWKDTYATLHMWTQIVGKIRLTQTPWVNHSWHTTLYVTSRGLTTTPISYEIITFQIDFDFIEHKLIIQTSDGRNKTVPLYARSVSNFYEELFQKMKELNLEVKIHANPNEVTNPILFYKDEEHSSYDPVYVTRLWHILVSCEKVFQKFRAQFIGKCSPVHFFWGSFDLAVTRFSGRTAPQHPGGIPHLPDWVAREAYSHEVSSCGFWPGNEQLPEPVFYAYAYPEPEGYSTYKILPASASYDNEFREFFLTYEVVRKSGSPEQLILQFMQSTYEAAATLGTWDRKALERSDSNSIYIK